MIAVDTNVLVAAHRAEMAEHEPARAMLAGLAEGRAPWGLPVYVIGEFLRVVTHQKARTPTPAEQAMDDIAGLLRSPSARVLRPTQMFWPVLRETVADAGAMGPLVHDAQIVAVCIEHGVDAIISEDRGMRRFRGIRVLTIDEAS